MQKFKTKSAKALLLSVSAFALVFGGCNAADTKTDTPKAHVEEMAQKTANHDKFTFANYDEIRVTHLDLNLDVKFDEKVLDGIATLDFKRVLQDANVLVLDSRDLLIKAVSVADKNGEWVPAAYTLGESDPALGSALTIQVGDSAKKVRIAYRTSPEAEGLQWLPPEQTAGKKHPYLFSQAQALNARTMAPLQDTPAVRITYTATLRTPPELLALMSAEQDGGPLDGEYSFNMPQPIPSYLLAIVVGDIKFKAINDHIGVYAEQYILDASAAEFEDTPLMEDSNAKLYGPYRWGRYDLIVLPPSFPFGGMENPRLSFMTPTLIAGDKSLTNVVAHELAHSWSGNLVTNSNWRDAWLNEGFTSYVENRVMEDLYGEDRAVMEQALGLEDLKRDIAGAERPELTQLKLPADIAHPDEAFSQVAYVKGQFFLMFLEERFGRDNFDAFLKEYFNHFAFQSITTEDFITYLHDELHVKNPKALTKAELHEWVYMPGLPKSAKNPQSDAFKNVSAQQADWLKGDIAAKGIKTADWSTHEWLHFLNTLPELSQAQYKELDTAFSLTGTQNAETAFAWYMQTIKGGYAPAMGELENFLMSVGRGKFIYRLYGALAESKDGKVWAQDVFSRAKSGYHPIAQRRISEGFEAK
ncbi:MAG: aminopeptidase [Robiginitomaculum sp.]|nr:MAG: aminopeptidase [Robiginitomaculum sp.]